MPLTTLADLVAAGAHRTLEQIVEKPGFDLSMAADYLSRRYGNSLQTEPKVIQQLVYDVLYGLHAATRTSLGDVLGEESIPAIPGLPPGFTYTVIGKVKDPLRPDDEDRGVTFPMKFTSEKPLTFSELQELSDELITQATAAGQVRFDGALHGAVTLPGAAAEVVRDTTGGQALPDITILSVYRGA